MKNKFEALAAFQSWPKDWQQLCAEFWAEGEEPQEVRFDARQLAIEPPQRAAKVKERRQCKKRCEWTLSQQDYLIGCVDRTDTDVAAAKMFLDRYPERLKTCSDAIKAVTKQIHGMRDANGVMHARG